MSQYLSTQPYKGTRDFYPEDQRIQRWMFETMRAAAESFGYGEYDGPMLEPFELYAAKSGEEIVNNQLYWMIDRGERKLAVRPEMTPTLARMVAGKLHELPKPVRWFSIPNLWRYERPQRGRLREHWQLNVDVLGGDRVAADAEVLQVALEIIRRFGGLAHVSIRVNNRRLIDHLFREKLGLSGATALGVTKALDARAKIGEEAYAKWLGELGVAGAQVEAMEAFFKSDFAAVQAAYPCDGTAELAELFNLMKASGLASQVVFDPTVMRGMDYYTGTVFEMYDVSPENRRAMFGGGRYDNLIGLFGKDQLSGVGFGMGDVGIRNFLETHGLLPKFAESVDAFVSWPSADVRDRAESIARALRAAGFRVATPLAYEGIRESLKRAVKFGARFAVLFGEAELAEGKVMLKDLKLQTQTTLPFDAVVDAVRAGLSASG